MRPRTAVPAAPWYVVPADRRWYRKWAVSRILRETLAEMDPAYPARDDLDVDALESAWPRPDRRHPGGLLPPGLADSRTTGRSDSSTMRPMTGRRYLSMSGTDSPRM